MYIDVFSGLPYVGNQKKDDFYLNLADTIATQSKDQETRVGCVAVDSNYIIVGSGYNGCNRYVKDEKIPYTRNDVSCKLKNNYKHLGLKLDTYQFNKYPFMLHAEQNLIFGSRNSLEGCTVYITHYPCANCFNSMIQSGIKRIIVKDNRVSSFESDMPKVLFILENLKIKRDGILIYKKGD